MAENGGGGMMPTRTRRGPVSRGFSLVELLIALVVLTVFFLPLIRNFTSIKRVSLAARDTVVGTSLGLSCLADLRALPFADLQTGTATFTRILDRYKTTVAGGVTYQTDIAVTEAESGKVKVIEITLKFNQPGSKMENAARALSLRDFAYADVD